MKLLFLLLIIFNIEFVAQTKEFALANATTYLGTELYAKALKRAVFAVQIEGEIKDLDKSNDWISIGSGFFVQGLNKVVLGITCNHVVAPFIGKRSIFAGIDTDIGYRRIICEIIYKDSKKDIAVLILKKSAKEDIDFQNLTFSEAMFDNDSSLVEGRGVIIPGYPLSLGTEDDSNHPVVRLGMIAQFTGKDYFLLDGVASHGNSGSPVFALNYKNPKLVGMITSYVNDSITLFDENGNITAKLPYNSGLARCVTIKIISEALIKTKGKY